MESNNKTVKQSSKPTINTNNNNNYHQLPTLIIRKTKGSNEFITEDLYLESSGMTLDEAANGLSFLIKQLKELEAKNDPEH